MNSLTIIGNITRDPESKIINEKEMSTFGIAVPRRKRDEVDFFRVTAFGKLAEIANTYVKKGMKVCVRGCINIRNYTKADGTQAFSVEVFAEDLELLSKVESSSGETQATTFTPVNASSTQTPPLLVPEDNALGDLPF